MKRKNFEHIKITYHDCANIFPLMEERDLDELVEDIRLNGLRESIKLLNGQIIDGRNRFRACLRAEVEPRFETVKLDNPLQYVISLNMHRRHLDESQRAWIAASMAKVQICTQSDASKMLNVSVRSIKSASSIYSNAIPEVCSAVQEGKIPVSVAAQIAKLEEKVQRTLVPMSKKERQKNLKAFKKQDIDDVDKKHTVGVHFTDEQLKMIDKAIARYGETRANFIQNIVVDFCRTGLPPTRTELKELSPSFIKKSYSDKDMIPGKRGISKQEEDEAKEYDRLAHKTGWFANIH